MCLARQEQRGHARTYLTGLVSDLKRKDAESIAYRHDQERHGLQHFVGSSTWDHRPLLRELASQVGRELGTPEKLPGVLAPVARAGHPVEECLQRSKGEAGLAEYQVRSWAGWHHHQALSLIASWFLV